MDYKTIIVCVFDIRGNFQTTVTVIAVCGFPDFISPTVCVACNSYCHSWHRIKYQVHCGTFFTSKGFSVQPRPVRLTLIYNNRPWCVCVIIKRVCAREPFHISLSVQSLPTGGVLFLAPWSLIKI